MVGGGGGGECRFARGGREDDGGAEVRLTLAALLSPDDAPEVVLERLLARVAQLRIDALPLLDPDPAGRFTVASAMPPEH